MSQVSRKDDEAVFEDIDLNLSSEGGDGRAAEAARALGLPDGWKYLAIGDSTPGTRHAHKFQTPSGQITSSLVEVKAFLGGELPKPLANQVRDATTMGLSEEWRVYIRGKRKTFIAPTGNSFDNVKELKDFFGDSLSIKNGKIEISSAGFSVDVGARKSIPDGTSVRAAEKELEGQKELEKTKPHKLPHEDTKKKNVKQEEIPDALPAIKTKVHYKDGVFGFKVNDVGLFVKVKDAGGNLEIAKRIAYLCAAKLEAGASKEDTTAYRKQLFETVLTRQPLEIDDRAKLEKRSQASDSSSSSSDSSQSSKKKQKRISSDAPPLQQSCDQGAQSAFPEDATLLSAAPLTPLSENGSVIEVQGEAEEKAPKEANTAATCRVEESSTVESKLANETAHVETQDVGKKAAVEEVAVKIDPEKFDGYSIVVAEESKSWVIRPDDVLAIDLKIIGACFVAAGWRCVEKGKSFHKFVESSSEVKLTLHSVGDLHIEISDQEGVHRVAAFYVNSCLTVED